MTHDPCRHSRIALGDSFAVRSSVADANVLRSLHLHKHIGKAQATFVQYVMFLRPIDDLRIEHDDDWIRANGTYTIGKPTLVGCQSKTIVEKHRLRQINRQLNGIDRRIVEIKPLKRRVQKIGDELKLGFLAFAHAQYQKKRYGLTFSPETTGICLALGCISTSSSP